MLLPEILILLLLLLIFLQDMASRAVYWFMFPLLAIMLTWLHIQQYGGLFMAWQNFLLNMGFLVTQFIFLTVYFSIKNKKWINISDQLLGLGDILFLLSTAVYLSVLNFLFFYLISLISVLLIWVPWQLLAVKKNKQIPLAGLQAFLFSVFLAGDWYLLHVNLTADTWLLNLIHK